MAQRSDARRRGEGLERRRPLRRQPDRPKPNCPLSCHAFAEVLHMSGKDPEDAVPANDKRYFVWLAIIEHAFSKQPEVLIVVLASWRCTRKLELLPNVQSYRILHDEAARFPAEPPADLIACPKTLGMSDPNVLYALAGWLRSSELQLGGGGGMVGSPP